jgi:hypothetical protein
MCNHLHKICIVLSKKALARIRKVARKNSSTSTHMHTSSFYDCSEKIVFQNKRYYKKALARIRQIAHKNSSTSTPMHTSSFYDYYPINRCVHAVFATTNRTIKYTHYHLVFILGIIHTQDIFKNVFWKYNVQSLT